MVVTSTGLRSTGGSLSQGLRSVRSCSALLFGDRGARYGVIVWSGVDLLTNLFRVVQGVVVSVVVVWSGVDVLTDSLPASRVRRKDAPRRWAVRHRKLDAPYRLTPLPCGGPARLDPSLELNQGDPPCSSPPWPRRAACSDRFWLLEPRVSQHFSTFYEPSVQAMDTQLNAPSTLPVLARTVSGCLNSAFLNISQHFTAHLFRPWIPNSARHRRWTPMIQRGRARPTISAGSWFGQWSPAPPSSATAALPAPDRWRVTWRPPLSRMAGPGDPRRTSPQPSARHLENLRSAERRGRETLPEPAQ